MPRRAQPAPYDPEISWKTLFAYASAVRQFLNAPAQDLAPRSLDKIIALDADGLPPARYLPLPGGALGYRCYEAAHSRRALVLVHGSGCFGDQLHAMARDIAGQDLACVYTLNMRGHGLSDGRPGHAAKSPHHMVYDVAAFVSHLRNTGEADSIILGGHSAGGGLVLGFARSAAQASVDGYLFLAPFLGLGSPVNRPFFGGWVKIRPIQLLLVSLANVLGIKRFNDTTVIDFDKAACARELRFVPNWSFNTLLAFGPGRWSRHAPPIAADKPTLLVSGCDDECFRQPLYRQAFQVLAAHAKIVEVGGGHWDILVDPDAIGAVEAWLATLPEAHRADKPHRSRISKAA
jgi:non-heme chloroperoxidase